MSNTEQYRFDDAYGKVYEYSEEHKAYLFIGTYLAYGIKANMREKTKVRLVEEE